MGKFDVVFSSKAKKSLKKMNQNDAVILLSWIKKNLVNTDNPRLYGDPMKGNLSNYWRYRIGKYRIIVEIIDNELQIALINIGHRKDIYKK